MKSLYLLVCTMVCWLSATQVARAQGVGASGNINGTVLDPTGAVVPKTNITAVDTARGTRYTTGSDNSGQYRLTGLPPGTYNVSAQIAGFQKEVQEGVIVSVGDTAIVDFHIKLASSGQAVEITAEPPMVDTERGSQANTVTQEYIGNLPIDRRDYLTFTLLMPGVSNSTRLADDQDFRVKQTPQSGLSFYGSNGRGNSVTVDGGEAKDDAGGVRPTVSQDAVQEFQVNRSNYGADLGGANGASINIVSKSGENDVHGTLYSYFRNDGLDARDPFAFSQALQAGQTFDPTAPDLTGSPVKDSLQRYQFGGTVGAPIRRDKTFFFAAFEGLRQDAENAVPLLTDTSIFRTTAPQNSIFAGLAAQGNTMVPCINNPDGTVTTLPAAVCAFGLQSLLTINANPSPLQQSFVSPGQAAINSFLIDQFETNGGLFAYNTREYLGSVRLDHRLNEANQLTLTYRYGHDLEQSPDVHSLTAFSAGSSVHTYDNNLQGAWFHQFSARTQNDFRAQWNYDSFNVIPNVPGEVGIQIPGFINNLGTNIFLPSLTILRRYEIADNVTWSPGNHIVKFGVDELLRGNHTESHTFLPGRFVFGSLPGVALSDCFSASPTPMTPNPCGLTTPGASIDSLQATSLSAPQVYQQGFGKADYPAYTRPLTGLYLQDSWQTASNFTLTYGLR